MSASARLRHRQTWAPIPGLECQSPDAGTAFQAGVTVLIQQLRASELATGVEHIYLPGELECRRREVAPPDGIPVPEEAITTLQAMAEDLGLACDLNQLPGDDHGYVAVYPHAAHHPRLPSADRVPQQTIRNITGPGVSPQCA